MARPSLKNLQQTTIKANPEDFYVKMSINKNFRGLLWSTCTAVFILLLMLIAHAIRNKLPWQAVAGPVSLLGFLTLLAPLSEEWLYRPWQAAPRQYEKHFHGKK